MRNCRFFRSKARPAPPRAPHMMPRRLPEPYGIDLSSRCRLRCSHWDPFDIMFCCFCFAHCASKRDLHFSLHTKTPGVSRAQGREDGRKAGRPAFPPPKKNGSSACASSSPSSSSSPFASSSPSVSSSPSSSHRGKYGGSRIQMFQTVFNPTT